MSLNHRNERYDFSEIRTSIPIPNLIDVQKRSYKDFLQMNLLPSERKSDGLQSVFEGIFPITDFKEISTMEFVDYSIGNWQCKCGRLKGLEHLRIECPECKQKITCDPDAEDSGTCFSCGYKAPVSVGICSTCGDIVSLKLPLSESECKDKEATYEVPLKVTIRLAVYDKDSDTGVKHLKDVKEEEVYFGDIPLMTDKGTFIINGTERVIVSQLHRSPGVFFKEGKKKKNLFTAKMIPYRGSWVEFEYDSRNRLYVRVDRKRKFLATVLIKALGFESSEEILRRFQAPKIIEIRKGDLFRPWSDKLVGKKCFSPIKNKSGRMLIKEGDDFTKEIADEIKNLGILIPFAAESYPEARVIKDIINTETGEVLVEANTELNMKIVEVITSSGLKEFEVFFPDEDDTGGIIGLTLEKDRLETKDDALVEIYRKMRPGDPPTVETSRKLFDKMFFDKQRYDLSRVGRLKFNAKLGFDDSLEERTLKPEDFLRVIEYLLKLRNGKGEVDDIDHLGNRRVRSVGELLENQFRIGLVRMERAVREKMSVYKDIETASPSQLLNAKPVIASVREFFGRSQLSQFMDQTNPLAEITHKRRLSALGPGGLSRERAGFDVRDVHPTHYGRICPVETPEGPNIGLISSLSTFARINEFGFIESPYRKVEKGRVVDYGRILSSGDSSFKKDEIVRIDEILKANEKLVKLKKHAAEFELHAFYLSAWEEDKYAIAQSSCKMDKSGKILEERVNVRKGEDIIPLSPDMVDFIDVSPKQLVSVAASLIPFLEHDDANRALMGSNMQRQSVPLLKPESPLVGTGMEGTAAKDSGAVILCKRSGVVDTVDSERIIVRVDKNAGEGDHKEKTAFGADIYSLLKFKRSNQNTCINQVPIVREGDLVNKGDVLADGPATSQGELSLGRNILVAFMPWRGYNFEDAIVVSEKLIKNDSYTSIHIEEFSIDARDTKLGPEEITRDIPNVSEKVLKELDLSGIIRIGASVKPGDILVGKVTPKGETQLSPEEKLLRAIFGEKAGDVKDASLKVPPGVEGIVVDAKVFTRKGQQKDSRTQEIEEAEVTKLEKNKKDETRIIQDELKNKMAFLLEGKMIASNLTAKGSSKILLKKGKKPTLREIDSLKLDEVRRIEIEKDKDYENIQMEIALLEKQAKEKVKVVTQLFKEKVDELKTGDDLPPGVIKMVKVYVAMKRKMSVGDKMAGRHGNKGVIAKIVPEEDMPYLPDGTPVEVVLNPLGVPSRMNVGQILETHLGWAAAALGLKFACPVFDGASEAEIKEKLKSVGYPESGKTILYDGKSGEPYELPVTVGYMYLMKLAHLVDDKIHARSIGPYSLITQQPLGGKAQFGGQRLGEMEVWALEAYGAAHILQEFLTAKSDDVYGRTKIYEAIVKGEPCSEPELPESFNVMVREMRSLGLDVELLLTENMK